MSDKVRVPETEAEYASLCKELLYEINYDASQGSCPERTRMIEEMETARRSAPFEYRDGVLVRKKAGASECKVAPFATPTRDIDPDEVRRALDDGEAVDAILTMAGGDPAVIGKRGVEFVAGLLPPDTTTPAPSKCGSCRWWKRDGRAASGGPTRERFGTCTNILVTGELGDGNDPDFRGLDLYDMEARPWSVITGDHFGCVHYAGEVRAALLPPDTTTPAPDVQGETKLAGNSDVQPSVTGSCGCDGSFDLGCPVCTPSMRQPASDVQARDNGWLCGVKTRPLTSDDLHHLRTQFRDMMESKGRRDHGHHLENYQCLVLNLAPALIASASDVQAQIDALKAENDHWRTTAKDRISTALADEMVREAVAREREECAKIAEQVWDSGNEGAHGGEQANRTAAAIRARSAKGVS